MKKIGKWLFEKSTGFFCLVMVISVLLTVAVCGAEAAEERNQEEVACLAGDIESGNTKNAIALTSAEKKLLAQLICAECRGEPYLCRVAVAAVIFNRMENEGFPDSVVNIVFSVGAFHSVESGELGRDVTDEDLQVSMEAVRQAAAGEDPTGGALYFAKEDNSRASINVCFRAGGMVFGR